MRASVDAAKKKLKDYKSKNKMLVSILVFDARFIVPASRIHCAGLTVGGSVVFALVERFDAVKFGIFQRKLSNFGELVLFCIETEVCNQIPIFKHFFFRARA